MKEHEVAIREHEFDGIQEFDNRLPNWWLMTLYGAIIFSVVYWLYYQTFPLGNSPEQNYVEEVAEFAEWQLAQFAGQELTNESLMLMSQVPTRVEDGKKVFGQFCVECHNPNGEGNIGPNLTDHYWLHGGKPLDIHKTVTDGIDGKGMAAWESQIGPGKVQQVVAYVLTLRGKNVEGKEAEGEFDSGEFEAETEGDAKAEASEADGVPESDETGDADKGTPGEK